MALQRVIGQMLFPLPVWFESLFSSTALLAPLPTWAPLAHTPLPEPDLEILEIQEYWHKTFNVCIASICVFILRCECDGGQGWYDTIESGSHLSLLTLFVGATIETYTSWLRDSHAFCLAWGMPSIFWKSFTGDFCRKNTGILKTMSPCWLIHFRSMLSSHLASPRLSLKDGDPFIYPFILPERISHVSTTSFT